MAGEQSGQLAGPHPKPLRQTVYRRTFDIERALFDDEAHCPIDGRAGALPGWRKRSSLRPTTKTWAKSSEFGRAAEGKKDTFLDSGFLTGHTGRQ